MEREIVESKIILTKKNNPLPPQASRLLGKKIVHKGTGEATFRPGCVTFDITLYETERPPSQFHPRPQT